MSQVFPCGRNKCIVKVAFNKSSYRTECEVAYVSSNKSLPKNWFQGHTIGSGDFRLKKRTIRKL